MNAKEWIAKLRRDLDAYEKRIASTAGYQQNKETMPDVEWWEHYIAFMEELT